MRIWIVIGCAITLAASTPLFAVAAEPAAKPASGAAAKKPERRLEEPCPSKPLRIVVPGAAIGPRQRVQLKTSPASEAGRGVRWLLAVGPGSLSPDGWYVAPYVIDADAVRALVQVMCKDTLGHLDTLAADTLRLKPGAFPGAESCLGTGQQFEGSGLEYQHLDELPEATTQVQPTYPRGARLHGAEVALVVNALVCKSGEVIDGEVTWPVGTSADPKIERAALDAAKQWVFKPGTKNGKPMAAIVAIPFRLKP